MAAFIAFIASLNLCLGYALGVYIGVMPGMTPRRRTTEDTDDTPIALPVAARESQPPAPASEQVEGPPIPAQATSPEQGEPQTSTESTPTPTSREETEQASQASPTPEAAGVSAELTSADYSNIVQGLEAFKSKLDSVSQKLQATQDNRAEVDECANELKEANNEYLEKASEAIQELAEDETEQQQLHESLSKQSAEVEQANQVIEGLLDELDTAVVRQTLLDSTEQLTETVDEVEQAIPQPAANREPEDQADQNSSFISPEELTAATTTGLDDPAELIALDELMEAVDRSIKENGPANLLQVGAIDLQDESGRKGEHIKRLLTGLEQVVAGELAHGQTLAIEAGDRFILHLPGDDLVTANERCERVRQQIAATSFQRNGEQLRATASCAVADVAGATDHTEVLERLGEALAEAKNLGDSCTVHHNGSSIEAVPAMKLDVQAKSVTI